MRSKKVLIIGAASMHGHALFGLLPRAKDWDVYATVHSMGGLRRVAPARLEKIIGDIDANDFDLF